MKIFRWLLVICMVIAAPTGRSQGLPGGSGATAMAATPAPRTQNGQPLDWFMRRHAQYVAAAAKGGTDVLFIGDSITEGWALAGRAVWAREFAQLRSANFGISGDRTEHVLWRVINGEVGGAMQPRVVVLMIGTNNTGQRKDTPEDIASGVGAIVEELKTRCPLAQVLLLGIFPRGERPDSAERLNNARANLLIARKADGKRVKYIDMDRPFLGEGGVISRELMPDFLHLSPQGYALWAKEIRSEVRAILERSGRAPGSS